MESRPVRQSISQEECDSAIGRRSIGGKCDRISFQLKLENYHTIGSYILGLIFSCSGIAHPECITYRQ